MAGVVWPLVLAALPGPGRAERLTPGAFTSLAQRCGPIVAPPTLAAVAMAESGFRTLVVADNSTGRSREFATLDEAASAGEALIARGHSVDLGLMQLNSANLRGLALTVRDALDPCRSIAGGAEMLSRGYAAIWNAADPQIALRHALSRYNTGSAYAGFRNGYVRRVEDAARSLRGYMPAVLGAAFPRGVVAAVRAGSDVGWDVWNDAGRPAAGSSARPSTATLIF